MHGYVQARFEARLQDVMTASCVRGKDADTMTGDLGLNVPVLEAS